MVQKRELVTNEFIKGLRAAFFLQVLIHSPYEFPEITKMGTSVGVGTETYIAISAQVTKS